MKLLDYFLFLPKVYAFVVIFYFFLVFLNPHRHYFIWSCSLRLIHISTILICSSLLAVKIFHLGAHASAWRASFSEDLLVNSVFVFYDLNVFFYLCLFIERFFFFFIWYVVIFSWFSLSFWLPFLKHQPLL